MRARGWIPALLALGAGASCAQAPAASDLRWGASAGVQHRRLVEQSDDGRRLVKETGPMLRLALDAAWPLAGGGALQAAAGVAAGKLDYEGQTQGGVRLTSETGHRDLDLALAWRPWPAAAWGEAWLLLRAAQQRRQIASTPAAAGLRETSRLLSAGARWAHTLEAGGWRWQPSIELRGSVHHRLDVDFGGVFDSAELEGGRRWEAALALEVASPSSPWSLGIGWTHARQSASARQPLYRGGAAAGTVFQPRIRIDDLAVRVRRAF